MATTRYSKQRESIKEYLSTHFTHPTAERIYLDLRKEFPNISQGTVYRNLNLLAEQGEILRISSGNGPDRFDFTLRNHYHGRCVRCGEVFDVDIDEMPGLIERIRDPHGMQFLSYDIMFKAICPACQMQE